MCATYRSKQIDIYTQTQVTMYIKKVEYIIKFPIHVTDLQKFAKIDNRVRELTTSKS